MDQIRTGYYAILWTEKLLMKSFFLVDTPELRGKATEIIATLETVFKGREGKKTLMIDGITSVIFNAAKSETTEGNHRVAAFALALSEITGEKFFLIKGFDIAPAEFSPLKSNTIAGARIEVDNHPDVHYIIEGSKAATSKLLAAIFGEKFGH